MSLKSVAAAVVLAASLAQPALADRFLGFERSVVVAPLYPPYAPYVPYAAPAYVAPSPYFYGYGPGYVPFGANWRDNWYDATRTKVHGYTLR
jgi:hypothetical protein